MFRVPPLIIALVLTYYWARVLRLAWKVRRLTGGSSSMLPAEKLGKILRVIWYPAVLVWAVHPYVTAFVANPPALVRPLWSNVVISWAAAATAVAALAATTVCWKRMGKSWRMGINPEEKTQLVVSGPYAYVRHPIYALSSILMLATMLAMLSPLMLAAGIVHLVLLQWEARREEKHLAAQHGQCYIDYCRAVGRFIPRSLKPYTPA